MIRRPPRSTPLYSSAASDVYKRQTIGVKTLELMFKNKLNILAVSKHTTIVVEKVKFYKALVRYNIKLYFID